MLSLFPQLLFLTPAAIALLRVVLGIYALVIAWHTSAHRHEMTRPKLPLIGHPPEWLVLVGACIYGVIGGLLVLGAWTQLVALFAALGALKLAIFTKWHPEFTTMPRSTYILLIVLGLALTCTGAGAFAFDLPL